MMNKILGILFLGFILVANVDAQDFRFDATVNKTTIGSNENLKLTLSLSNAKASGRIMLPKLNDWQIVSGPSTQNSVNIVNGQMTSVYSEIYLLRPLKEGNLQIPEATVMTDKGKLATKTLTIQVVKGSAPATAPNPGQVPQPNAPSSASFFTEVQLSKSKVYIGEPVMITYRFYSENNPRQIEKADYPKLEGFWTEDIETNINVEMTVVNGRRLYTAVIKKQLLFPQVSGKIDISGFDLTMIVSVGNNMFFSQNARVSDNAPAVKLEVLPYPSGAPADAVGTFDPLSLSVTTDVTTLKTNEAINLKAVFSGKGNLKMIDEIPFEFPGDFEVFEPKTKDNIGIGASGESGSRTFEYILIPRLPGDYEIPSIDLSYFDATTKSFKKLSTGTMKFHVEKGSDNAAGNYVYDSRTDVQILNQDIRFIKEAPGKWSGRRSLFLGSIPFYGLMVLPFILFSLVVATKRKRDREESDVQGTHKKQAGKMARKHLSNASSLLKKGDISAFNQELLGAMNRYLSYKLVIPVAEMSKNKIREKLSVSWTPDKINKLVALLEKCEFARFSGNQNQHPNAMLNEATQIIEELEKTIR